MSEARSAEIDDLLRLEERTGRPGSPESFEPLDDEAAQDAAVADISDLRPWVPSVRERIREAWESRHIARALAATSVPTYRGRVLGRGWLVIRPFMQVFGFGLVFGGVFGATAPNGVPYLLFLVFSMQAFMFFERTVYYETLSSRMVGGLTKRLRMPLLLIPVTGTFSGVVILLVYWGFAAVLLVYYLIAKGHFYLTLSPRLLVGFAGLALCLLFALAIGLTTSALYPRIRDIRYVVRYALQFWVFLTPVFYSVEQLPHWAQVLSQFNPLTQMIVLVQYGFLDAGTIHPWGLVWSICAVLLTGAFGLWFFNRYATQWIGIYTFDEGADDEEGDLI